MKKRRLVGFVLALAGLLAAWILFPRSPSLLAQAHRVAPAAHWMPETITPVTNPEREPEYDWQSDHEIIAYRDTEKGAIAFRTDIRTGLETTLAGFNQPAERRRLDVDNGCKLSPNGKWLLWHSPDSPNEPVSWFAANEDCTTVERPVSGTPSEENPGPDIGGQSAWAWMPGSDSWLSLIKGAGGLHALLYPLNPHLPVRTIKVTLPKEDVSIWGDDPPLLLGFTQEGLALAAAWEQEYTDATEVHLLSFRLPSGEAGRKITVRLPKPAFIQQIALSPSGDRLAWLLWHDQTPGRFQRFLHRWFSSVKLDSKQIIELWISRTDGSNMHEIGQQELPIDSFNFLSLHWTPNGKALSFYYKDALYAIPVG